MHGGRSYLHLFTIETVGKSVDLFADVTLYSLTSEAVSHDQLRSPPNKSTLCDSLNLQKTDDVALCLQPASKKRGLQGACTLYARRALKKRGLRFKTAKQ